MLDRKTLFLIVLALSIKGFLALITPRSFDFINIAYMGSFKAFKLPSLTPYFFTALLMNLPFRLWLLIPISHPPVTSFLKHGFFTTTFEAFLYMAMMKIPMIIFDGLTGLMIYKIVKFNASRSAALTAAWLWFFNPYLTIAIEMDGTIDVVSVFFALASLYFFIKEKFGLSGVLLTIGAVARFWPLALIPFYLIILAGKKAWRNLIAFILSFSITILAFITSIALIKGLKVFQELSAMLISYAAQHEFKWFLGFNISGWGWRISIGLVSLLYIFQAFLTFKFWRKDLKAILNCGFLILLAFTAFAYWNRYYTIWVTPLLIIDYALNNAAQHKKELNYKVLFILFWVGLALFNFSLWWIPPLFFIYPYTNWLLRLDAVFKAFGTQETSSLLIPTFGRSISAASALIYFMKVNFRGFKKEYKNIFT
ncbi:hypothetical protein KEJ50_06035 [Candidatus Bathyarchaeota archaeon]|nr:hypothetical protein [Candidatus Bathyarchaeota archaeon]